MALDPVTALLNIADTVVSRLFPDPAQAAAAKLELIKLQQSGELAQITGQLEINKVEAASSSTFVAGWRPAVGWTCAAAFAVQFVGAPIVQAVAAALGHPVTVPPMDMEYLMTVLMGMLGLGGLRTFEKIKRVAR